MSDVGKSRIVGKPRKVVRYIVLEVDDQKEYDILETYLSKGWELYGSPVPTRRAGVSQAMVRYEVVEPIKLPVRD